MLNCTIAPSGRDHFQRGPATQLRLLVEEINDGWLQAVSCRAMNIGNFRFGSWFEKSIYDGWRLFLVNLPLETFQKTHLESLRKMQWKFFSSIVEQI